ncbi:sugar ABC transporter substrate-binding protein [Kribbella jejuensis]|uniref:Multiple sugar transport system substrate-binding protein n=1 Tax=Kribbella jejuensis TaxID=236068 RepID=A0A542EA60_9ACTN|nr:extracellular solute-binding protein [Kribbella jejuensis]TQJ12214.1 multiple sugar transport system substrate-binding protein [Kribbella jejuensis]
MPRNSRRAALAGLALCLAVATTAACSNDTATNAAKGTSAGPVQLEYWGWTDIQPVVDKFNANHTDIKVKFVKQADLPSTATTLRNAVAAGSAIPCLSQNFGDVPALLSEGLLTDVTDYLKPAESKFKPSSLSAAKVQDKYYGIPLGTGPTFMMINRAVYDKYGVRVPKTWDDVIAAGKALKPHGVQVMNLAGEDPSTLVNLIVQAGGTWYSVQNDSWKVDFLSPESVAAANILQQLVDNGLVANQTYQDRPALIAYFDQGKMVSLPTSTWQLANYELHFKKTIGDWEPVDLPQFADATKFATPAHGNALLVPKGCQHPKEATEVGIWMNTTKDGIDATYDKTTGAYAWPGAMPDPSPWVDASVPRKLFGSHRSEAQTVINKASASGVDNWLVGPNYTGVFKELQDQWAQAVTKKITFRQLLENMQKFTVDDLKAKGINVSS